MWIVFFLLLPLLFSVTPVLADPGFDEKYERDYHIFNPASQYAPDNLLNPAQAFAPDNPFNPVNPTNRYAPDNPFDPANQYHPDNPTEPCQPLYLPLRPAQPLAVTRLSISSLKFPERLSWLSHAAFFV